jgi:hypothetical protein
MKRLILILALLGTSACSSAPKHPGYQLPPVLRETFRGGAIEGMKQPTALDGMPAPYDQVSHTCTSTPIYHLDGTFAHTDVRCW